VLGLSAAPERSLWPAGLLALALPLGLWAYAAGLLAVSSPAASAQEERAEPPAVKTEREDNGEKVEARPDRPREREGDRERAGDRPREGDRGRDGDNPEAARLKRERIEEAKFFGREKELLRDGDRPAKEGPRDGQARREGPRDGDQVAALRAMVKRLSAENQRLRAELAKLRGGQAREKEAAAEWKEIQLRERERAERQAPDEQ
jgi:hypothetical protein